MGKICGYRHATILKIMKCPRRNGFLLLKIIEMKFYSTSPHISPHFVARASRHRCGWAHAAEDGEGIADTMSNRLARVCPVTASGSAATVDEW